MILLPAIDMLGGRAVRLDQGDYARRTDYYPDPVDAAKRWVEEGAEALHVVDLDGARTGAPENLRHLYRIVESLEVPVEFGGGLRSDAAVADAFSAGAAEVIIGTAAFKDAAFLERILSAHGERVIVSVDARAGHVASAGWLEQTDLSLAAAFTGLQEQGVRRFVFSSIDRDGMLSGPDLEGARAVDEMVDGSYVYSGGISSLADLEQLGSLALRRLRGVIVGKALFEGRFTVAEGQAALSAGASER
ncbi:HisA/HisF-related TIM barrel protein [Conexibacter sp. DBS9H8]|uniref:1-(5-phosphoribosyl)-5-[(5- phosphoribosylamino)methylideneamino]imidazole-4- carboxamide isomerase n=1 Tax=Conexibacter sp. DBS9H8 TaxID=2937801 RepID=UPI00200CDB80|nr:1-(5-phosphoribosyl)-5-[(5-phosphoribosylamino)methylideneamino] imidazole-4-carboxamide isomerase [Conexibacter sp. DBS9H8]